MLILDQFLIFLSQFVISLDPFGIFRIIFMISQNNAVPVEDVDVGLVVLDRRPVSQGELLSLVQGGASPLRPGSG